MTDYPSNSPWGPHGPQVDAHSVTPNPTAQTPQPDFGGSAPEAWPAPSAPSGGGGGGSAGGSAPGAGAYGAATGALSSAPIGKSMRNLAIGGAVLGCLAGVARSVMLHLPPPSMGAEVFRLGLAGASAGAGFPPAIRACFMALRAFVWIALALFLWAIAIALSGQAPWLTNFR